MGGNTLAGLLISLGINASSLKSGLNAAKSEISSFTSSVHSTLSGITSKLDIMGRIGGGLRSVFQGVGIALGFSIWGQWERVIASIVRLLPSLIDKAVKFGESIHTLQEMTGATAETASRFVGVQMYLGLSTDDLARRISQLSRNVISHQYILDQLKIKVKDSNGAYLDQITILDNVRSALARVDNGVTKTALLVALLGRGGYQMADYFNLTDQQVKLLNAELDNLGVTMDENAIQKSIQAQREFNLFGTAVQGLANQLFMNVAPALITAIDSLVRFVKENGEAIAQFAAQVVNFVLGMISALTGATITTVNFTQQMINAASAVNASTSSIDEYADSLNKKAKADTSATDATARHIRAIDAHIAAIRELDRAQQVQYDRQMDRIRNELNAQLDALDAKEKAFQTQTKNIDLAQQLENAQRALGMARAGISASGERGAVNPQDVAAAQIEVNRILREIGLQTMKDADDRERDRIKKVQDYLAQLVEDERDAVNKKAFLHELNSKVAILHSQIAAAKQRGDLQAVADLTMELQGVTTTRTRIQQEIRNDNSTKALEAEKLRLQDLKRTIASVEPVMQHLTPVWNNVTTILNTASKTASDMIAYIAAVISGKDPKKQGLVGALDEARLAGIKFGTDVKEAFGELIDVVKNLLKMLKDVLAFFGSLADVWNALPGPLKAMIAGAIAGARIGGLPGAIVGAGAGLGLEEVGQPGNNISIRDYTTTEKLYKALRTRLKRLPTRSELSLDMSQAGISSEQIGLILAFLKGKGVLQGWAAGGWVGLHGPEVGLFGEKGPEFVVPADKTHLLGNRETRREGGGTLIVQVGPEKLVEIVDRRLWISRSVYGEPVLASGSTR